MAHRSGRSGTVLCNVLRRRPIGSVREEAPFGWSRMVWLGDLRYLRTYENAYGLVVLRDLDSSRGSRSSSSNESNGYGA